VKLETRGSEAGGKKVGWKVEQAGINEGHQLERLVVIQNSSHVDQSQPFGE